jgi:hypothetical protein
MTQLHVSPQLCALLLCCLIAAWPIIGRRLESVPQKRRSTSSCLCDELTTQQELIVDALHFAFEAAGSRAMEPYETPIGDMHLLDNKLSYFEASSSMLWYQATPQYVLGTPPVQHRSMPYLQVSSMKCKPNNHTPELLLVYTSLSSAKYTKLPIFSS